MHEAGPGTRVGVHYAGELDDGSAFDSSADGDPMLFTIGAGEVIPGFENAVVGMRVGEEKRLRIPPADAYGDRDDDQVMAVPRSDFPPGIALDIGMELQTRTDRGDTVVATVVAIGDDMVTVDMNHPLAGEALTFTIRVVSIG